MDNRKMMKPRKSKNKNQSINSRIVSKAARRKTIKRSSQFEQDLKKKIIKLFICLGEQQINYADLRWVFLNLGFSSEQIIQIKASLNKDQSQASEQILYDAAQVYSVCQRQLPNPKWKRQCFECFSQNKKALTLQDLQLTWDFVNNNSKSLSIPHQNLAQIFKIYGLENQGYLNYDEFSNLLTEKNLLS